MMDISFRKNKQKIKSWKNVLRTTEDIKNNFKNSKYNSKKKTKQGKYR